MATIKIVGPDGTASGGTGSDANPYRFADMMSLIQAGAPGAWANWEWWLNDGVYTRSATWFLANGGTSAGDMVVKARNPQQAIIRAATGSATTRIALMLPQANANYVTLDGVYLDGAMPSGGTGNSAIQTLAGANLHHWTVKNCYATNLQGALCEFASCDYVKIIGNYVWDNGKRPAGTDQPDSTSSGISLNAKSAPFVFDAYTGFHNIVAYNRVAGHLGGPSDGSGVILDNGGSATSYALQNTLIIRNICYGNGRSGIHGFRTAAPQGHWIVNNLSFKNGLDLALAANTTGAGSEIDVHVGGPWYLSGNVAVPWTGTGNLGTTAYRDVAPTSDYHLYANKRVTGGRSSNPLTAAAGEIDDITITQAGFASAPTYNPNTLGDPYLVPDPVTVGSGFDLLATSSLRDTGIDPRVIAAMNANMISDITPYIEADIAGRTAPR